MSVGSTIVRTGSAATVAELAQRVEALERFLSGGIGPVDLMGAIANGAVDLGGPAQRWRRIYADGLTVGATDVDLTTVAQQLAATSPVVYSTAGDHAATTAITTLAFLALGGGGQGGGGGAAFSANGEFSDCGSSGLYGAIGGAIIMRASPTDSIVVTIGDGGDGGGGGLSYPKPGAAGSVGGNTIVTVGGVARLTLAGGIGGGAGNFQDSDIGSQAANLEVAQVNAGPGAGGLATRGGPGGAGTKGGPGFCMLIPVTPAGASSASK